MPRTIVSLLFITLLFITLLCLCPKAQAADTHIPKAVKSAQFASAKESIGGIRLGLPEKDLPALLACEPQKAKEIYEGATGEYVQTWKYPDCGISLKLSSPKRGGPKSVASISLGPKAQLKTSQGLGIGSSEDEVSQAYGRFRDRENSRKGQRFVAGSIYDGLIFDFKDAKVSGIFLGAAAE